jgi:hypothetical protein
MDWRRFVAVVIGSGIVCSLTDWFFAGDWLHRRYTYPEIWREGAEGRAIALTSPLPFLTCGVFAYVIARLSLHSVGSAVKLAFAVWLLGPLPCVRSFGRIAFGHQSSPTCGCSEYAKT